MAKIIVFGLLDTSELAHFYIKHDTNDEVVAFTVNREYLKEDIYKGLPVIAFEELEDHYTPDQYLLFAPMTGKKMNTLREKVFNEGKKKGYGFYTYISSKATVFPEAEIGENCFILEDNTIQPFTTLGDNIVLWSGNHIGHHGRIDDHVFFTSHVVLSGHCHVKPYCFFGVNATIRDFTTLEEGTLVAMDASITKNTEAWGVYLGSPAKKKDNVKSIDVY